MSDTTTEAVGESQEPRVEAVGTGLKIGRYQLLQLVGQGGMGMVWGAWDPQLERRVALKLVHRVSATWQERILREGQVLAKLSHPNVVPIFDVGVAGEQVYLVMEWVRGKTLRAFAAEQPGWRAIVDAYRQAGAGLVAAHGAGVVHRDFKPDNVIRGDDDRVRVLDFGIAQASAGSDSPGPSDERAVGTPRYRSPEQQRGESPTTASDQYAFALSLREALSDSDPPAWISAIAGRGTAEDPARRFPSMATLLAALDDDPGRRRRRLVMGGAIAVALGGAFLVGSLGTSGPAARAVDPCSGGAAGMAESWSPALRDRVTSHLSTLGRLSEPEVERFAAGLDGHAADWTVAYRETCLAHARNELTDARYDERLACLARARVSLGVAGELLAEVDAAGLADAMVGAASISDAAGCADQTTAIAPPPAAIVAQSNALGLRLARAEMLVRAMHRDAADATKALVDDARLLGYQPLLAQTLYAYAGALMNGHQRSTDVLEETWRLALLVSDDALAVEAYADWMFTTAMANRFDSEGWPIMSLIADRLGPAGVRPRLKLYRSRAAAHLQRGDDPAVARELLERALHDIEEHSASDQRASLLRGLGNLEDDPARAATLHRSSIEHARRYYGPEHPKVWAYHISLGSALQDLTAARAAVETGCRGLERWENLSVFNCAYEAGWLAHEAGEFDAALAWWRKAAAANSPHRRLAEIYVAWRTGAADLDERIAERLKVATDSKPKASWEHGNNGDIHLMLALIAEDRGDRKTAEARWRDAATHLDKAELLYRRRRAWAHRRLAELLAATDPTAAAHHADLARAFYGTAP